MCVHSRTGLSASNLPSCSILTCQIVKGVARQLQPTVRRFVELGMQRAWMRGGELCFQKGAAATELFVIVSGRLRLVPSTEKDGKVCV